MSAVALLGRALPGIELMRSANYPQAIVLSTEHYSAWPGVLSQKGTILRSPDTGLQIHAWYSENLGIGRRQSADGPCDHMYGHERFVYLERRVSLTICDDGDTRTFYVQQGIHLTWSLQAKLNELSRRWSPWR